MLPSWKVSAPGRDNIMEIFIKYLTLSNGVGWSKRFMEIEGKLSFLKTTITKNCSVGWGGVL